MTSRNRATSSGRFADRYVYDRRPGLVAGCPHGGEVNACMVRTATDMWLELHGSTFWRMPVSPPV